MRHALKFGILGLLASGCLEEEPTQSYFLRPQSPASMPVMTPASTDSALRVDTMGRRLLASNPAIGAKPMFHTIGSPQAEIFHRGTGDIFVTEGLVKQCSTDGHLATVLATEMAKFVREREAATSDKLKVRELTPPIEPRLGGDDLFSGTSDRSNGKELFELDQQRKNRRKPLPLPDAEKLAREYVINAGFTIYDYETTGPILQGAAVNTTLEKQITAPPPTVNQQY